MFSRKWHILPGIFLWRGSILSSKVRSLRSLNAQPEKVHSSTVTHSIGQIKPQDSTHSRNGKVNPISKCNEWQKGLQLSLIPHTDVQLLYWEESFASYLDSKLVIFPNIEKGFRCWALKKTRIHTKTTVVHCKKQKEGHSKQREWYWKVTEKASAGRAT